MLGRLWRRLRALVRSDELDRELNEELRYHLEREAELRAAEGMTREEARLAALRDFGGVTRAKEECREARGVRLVEDLWQDVRYGLRTFRKKPGFTLVAVLTLALGIGANAAIFSAVNGVLLKSLPFPEAERLVALYETNESGREIAVAYPDYRDWRAGQSVFEEMGARMPAGGVLTGEEGPERVTGRWVTASFFRTLGVRPAAGRFFTEEEDRPGGPPLLVLSHGLWLRRYGGDPGVVGRDVTFNGASWTVAGVMPPQFDFYGENNLNNQFFVPLGQFSDQKWMHERASHVVMVTARLKPGVTMGQARAQMEALAARLAGQFPETNGSTGVRLRSFLDDYVGEARPALLMLMTAVGAVLLIACANVANLLLVRAAARRKEIALRVALGAGRGRVVRQLLTESLLLAAGGGALGLLFAWWGVGALLRLAPDVLPRMESIALDGRALGFTFALTLLTGVAFGLVPALQTSKADLNDAMKSGGAGGATRGGGRWLRSGLVVTEVALSLVLLAGAGLLLRSFSQLMRVEPGFEARDVLTLRLRLPDARYTDGGQIAAFLKEVKRRVEALPGVRRVSVATGFPFGRAAEKGYWLEGMPEPRQSSDWPDVYAQWVSPEFHQTLGIGLLAGRYIEERDVADSPQVALVDDEFVRRNFPNGSPPDALGKRLRFGGDDEPWFEIVGVVSHVRQNGLDEEGRPGVYRPWAQIGPRQLAAGYTRAMDFIVKTSVEPTQLVEPIRGAVQSLDRDQPLGNVRTLESLVEQTVAPRRFSMTLATVFACVALVLGAVGLYGVLSYTVAQRAREIGIRMALGARRADVHRLVISQGMALALAGVAAGVAASLALTRLMSGLLFGVSATDAPTFVVITLLLLLVALVACYLPARRASKVDPLIALRYE
ncbi:MAG TPA: ABC transporter permease [Pyrinomonadaceae bacterium]|nr:ABC transporter permease [Pyrinomonadaceae bacterium]